MVVINSAYVTLLGIPYSNVLTFCIYKKDETQTHDEFPQSLFGQIILLDITTNSTAR